MEIIPVIYILNGQCTALYKGDYGQKKIYGGSPLEWAKRFINEGAKKIYLAAEAVKIYGPEKIVIQIFAKRDELIENREKRSSDDFIDVVDYAEKLIPLGVKYVIYKDRRSEGILTHPNYDEIDRLFLTCGNNLKIYSSGGISEIAHLRLLKKIGAYGAMLGKVLFERTLIIDDAVEALRD